MCNLFVAGNDSFYWLGFTWVTYQRECGFLSHWVCHQECVELRVLAYKLHPLPAPTDSNCRKPQIGNGKMVNFTVQLKEDKKMFFFVAFMFGRLVQRMSPIFGKCCPYVASVQLSASGVSHLQATACDRERVSSPVSPPDRGRETWQIHKTGSCLFPQQIQALFSEALWMADGRSSGSLTKSSLCISASEATTSSLKLRSSRFTAKWQENSENGLQVPRSSRRYWCLLVAQKKPSPVHKSQEEILCFVLGFFWQQETRRKNLFSLLETFLYFKMATWNTGLALSHFKHFTRGAVFSGGKRGEGKKKPPL